VIYLNFVVYAGYFLIVKAVGAIRDAAAFADLYWRDPTVFYFLGRAISSAFGVAAVVMCWRWARESYGTVAGLAAAAFVALAPAAVKASAIALPDMAAAALGAASLAYAVRFVREPKTRHFVIAGFLLGLGAAAKYHVLLYAPALISCPFLAGNARGNTVKTLFAGAAATVVAFILACPFAVLDARTFFSDLAFMGRRPGMVRWLPSPGYVLGTTIPLTLSWPLVALAGASVVSLIRRHDRFALVVALAAAPFVVATLIRPLPPRHLLPLIPPLAIAAGAATANIADFKTDFFRVITTIVVAVLFGATLAGDVAHVAWSWRKDARSAAAEWFAANIPAGTTVIVEALPPDVEGPPLWPSKKALAGIIKYYRDAGGGSPGRYAYQLKNKDYPFGRNTYDTRLVAELDDLTAAPTPAYAVLAVPDDRDVYAEQAKPYGVALSPRADEYSQFLKSHGSLVKRFTGGRRPGPTVEIYRLN
jgi:hypothetical protein